MAKVVVIDDSKLMRSMIRHFLEQAGHEVEEWAEVAALEVSDRMAVSRPELIVTDYQMPGCNGATIAKLAHQVAPNLPILVVTATHDPVVTVNLHHQQVTRILYKPFKEEDLLEAVKALLVGSGAA
jgi:DNA-binding NarL/FixJ family response regulator